MSHRSIQQLGHAIAHDRDGHRLGPVTEIYISTRTGEPSYAEIHHGLFGVHHSIVPLRGHTLEGKTLTLAFRKDKIKDAPHISAEEHLRQHENGHCELCAHYALDDIPDVHTYTDAPLDYTTGEFDDGHHTRGFGDSPLHGGASDRLRAVSDHELGLDRTPEQRAMRGTSTHGMSDEPREYRRGLEDTEVAETDDYRTATDEDEGRGISRPVL